MKATIKGHTHYFGEESKEFTTSINFKLHPPKENEPHYGTGYYMSVNFEGHSGSSEYVDVRYLGTTDIKKLANLYIEDRYGKNAEEVIFEEE